MISLEALEANFHEDMLSILEKERTVGLRSVRFGQMLEEYGGLQTARKLLEPGRKLPPDTFSYLRRIGRPDLTLEYYVGLAKYESLFKPVEREIAKWRLENED